MCGGHASRIREEEHRQGEENHAAFSASFLIFNKVHSGIMPDPDAQSLVSGHFQATTLTLDREALCAATIMFNLKVSTMPTPLIEGRNIGPVTAREFERLGIYTVEQLRELGWKEACLLWVERFPSRINLNAFRSVAGAVYGVDYNQIPPDEDADVRRTIIELRRAAGTRKPDSQRSR